MDWRARIGATHFGDSIWPAAAQAAPSSPRLILQVGKHSYTVDASTPVLTVGRDPQSHLCIDDVHSSRHHCRIELEGTRLLLTDSSTNGTTVVPENGEPHTVKNASCPLNERGLLFFGRPFKGDRRGAVRFEVR